MNALKGSKVLLGPSTFAAQDPSPMESLAAAGCEIIINPFGRKLTKQELIELLPGVKGLIAGLETLDEDVMRKSELKVISRCGSGLSNVDMKAAGIVDPVKVTISAVQNAASVGGMLLTVEATVTDLPDKEREKEEQRG